MYQQPNGDYERRPKRSPLLFVLIAMLAVILILACVVFSLVLPMFQHEDVAQPTIFVEEEPAQEPGETVVMTAEMMHAEESVQALVASYGEQVAVSVQPLDDMMGFAINGDEQFVSASMIKLSILATYMHEVDEGSLNPQSSYQLKSSDFVGGAGVVAGSGAGTSITYATLAKDMIMYSDNTATNILIDTMGKDQINAHVQELGLEGTQLNRRMMRQDEGSENLITANDCAWLLREIARGSLASPEMCSYAEEYLLAQTDTEGIAEGLPSSVDFGHKTGSLSTVRHDGGIVYAPYPYVLVVLTSLDESTANALMARISAAVYENLE